MPFIEFDLDACALFMKHEHHFEMSLEPLFLVKYTIHWIAIRPNAKITRQIQRTKLNLITPIKLYRTFYVKLKVAHIRMH